MKKLLIALYVFLLISITYLGIIFKTNNDFLKNYNKGVYETTALEKVLLFNLYQPYVPLYNYGNALYKTAKYEDASIYYLKALEYNVPDDLVCYIRVNYVLSELKQMDSKMKDNLKLAKYKELREFLYLDNCAIPGEMDGSNQNGSNGSGNQESSEEGESGNESGNGNSGNQNGNSGNESGEDGLESGQGGQGGQSAAEDLEGELSDMEEKLDGSGSSSGSQSGNSGNSGNQSGSSTSSGVDQDRMEELQEQNNQAAEDRNNANNNGTGSGAGMGSTQNPNEVYW